MTAAVPPSTARLTAHRARSSTPPCETQRSSNMALGVHACWCVLHPPYTFRPLADTPCDLCTSVLSMRSAHARTRLHAPPRCTRSTRCSARAARAVLCTRHAASHDAHHCALWCSARARARRSSSCCLRRRRQQRQRWHRRCSRSLTLPRPPPPAPPGPPATPIPTLTRSTSCCSRRTIRSQPTPTHKLTAMPPHQPPPHQLPLLLPPFSRERCRAAARRSVSWQL